MQKLRLLKTGFGDLCLAEWESGDVNSVAVAEETFLREIVGRMAFRLEGKGDSAPIQRFCPEANEILIVPAVTGG